MSASDPAAAFSAAEQAFAAGRIAETIERLEALERALPAPMGAVLHLKGLALRRAGRGDAGHAALLAAHRIAPRQPEIAANLGNSARDMGDERGAEAAWRTALRLAPDMLAPRLALGALLVAQRRHDEASRLYADAPPTVAAQPGLFAARGALARAMDALVEAEQFYRAAVARKPDHSAATHGLARVALERGRAEASALYRTALSVAPGDADRLLGLAQALEQEGRAEDGIALLAEAVARAPGWLEGHRTLARMRWEAGDRAAFTASIDAAGQFVGVHDRAHLARLHIELLHGVDDFARSAQVSHQFAHDAAMRPADRRWFALNEARSASEDGDLDRADAVLAGLGLDEPPTGGAQVFGPDAAGEALVSAFHALRRGDPGRAARWLEPLIAAVPANVSAWALVDLAWRMLGDDRHAWLHGQDGLVALRPLALDGQAMERIAAWLRGLHRTRAFPIGQSLRGGTQTRGALFQRWEPEAALLRDAIAGVVAAHMAALPPADARHPLLAHRGAPTRFSGSWSVRLGEGGFHVAHIHPEGLLSSACYIVLPDVSAGDGLLEVGRPPRGLAEGLGPLQVITPRVGHCALFPSTMYHGTRPFAVGERMSVAFDVALG